MDTEQAEAIIGRLVSRCASIEFAINFLVEGLFANTALVDKLEEMNVPQRWHIIRSELVTRSEQRGLDATALLKSMDDAMGYYSNHLQRPRNLVAHSPLNTVDDSGQPRQRIISSRRYKAKGMDSRDVSEIEALLPPFGPLLSEAFASIFSLSDQLGMDTVRVREILPTQ